ncbi:Transcription elongation factor SPT5 (DRB sensitivity-inducing factor large subunit) (DSIF large subunit) [Durusdinium trenchii]|uniref:Transcription elongation factor SPT5 n=1 Tax=Durusdinium trenchii TaxID=1381693 RepID=A0ABP0ILC8_9DINO
MSERSSSEESSDEEEERRENNSRGGKKFAQDEDSSDDSGSDDSDDDEDEEEDEEEDDHARNGKRKKGQKGGAKNKRKRDAANAFFEEYAEDDDEEEDVGGDSDREIDVDDDAYNQAITQRYNERLIGRQAMADMDDEGVRKLAEKFERKEDQFHSFEEDDMDEHAIAPRDANLPTVADPKLFCVGCKRGDEQMLCMQLMNKYLALSRDNKQPKIFSVVTAGTKGFIYVEARTQEHAVEALNGIRGVYRTKVKMVPLAEMPTVMRVVSQERPVKVGDFVRLRRFPYKGDLGRVVDVIPGERGIKLAVRFVPRLDLTHFESNEEKKEHLAKKIVPPRRFFNAEEVQNAGWHPERKRDPRTNEVMDYLEGDSFHKGYQIKEFNIRMLQTKDINPTLEELQEFRHGKTLDPDEEEDADEALHDGDLLEELGNAAVPTREGEDRRANAAATMFQKGDKVVVRDGELQYLKGEVVSVDAQGNIKMNPLDASVRNQFLDFPASQLMKLFTEGDHVKVLNGRYASETGTVCKIMEDDSDKWKAIVFTDSANKEIVVFIDDLKISAEVAQARDSLKNIHLLDLVSLGNQVGIVVKIGSETVDVLLQTGTIRSVGPHEVRGKLNNKSRNTSAQDKLRNSISVNSMVKVVAGDNAGLEATVKHIHRSFLFLHSRMRLANAGIFVERSRNVQLAGIKLRNAGGVGMMQAAPGVNTRGGRGRGMGRGAGSLNNRDDDLVGKSVVLTKGRFKGYIGIAVSATPETVKVEIHSQKRIIDVSRSMVEVVGDNSGPTRIHDASNFSNMYGSSAYAGAPEAGPTATPYGGSTPMHAPGTPGGSGNDVWNPNVGGTPEPTTPEPENNVGGDASTGVWDPSREAAPVSEAYRPPPTPAAYGMPHDPSAGPMPPSYGYVATPAAIPQTPATPAIPQTPAALDGDGVGAAGAGAANNHGFRENERIRVVEGANKGSEGVFVGVDGHSAIIRVDQKVQIWPINHIVKAD